MEEEIKKFTAAKPKDTAKVLLYGHKTQLRIYPSQYNSAGISMEAEILYTKHQCLLPSSIEENLKSN